MPLFRSDTFTLGIKRCNSESVQKINIRMFIITLLKVLENLQQHTCPTMNNWLNNDIYILEYDKNIKMLYKYIHQGWNKFIFSYFKKLQVIIVQRFLKKYCKARDICRGLHIKVYWDHFQLVGAWVIFCFFMLTLNILFPLMYT